VIYFVLFFVCFVSINLFLVLVNGCLILFSRTSSAILLLFYESPKLLRNPAQTLPGRHWKRR
jgi:hypothetical protein